MALIQRGALALLVLLLMGAVGLRTPPSELLAEARRPARLGALVVANLLAVPAVALLLPRWIPLPHPVSLGLLLCACSPGGATAPLFVAQARGALPLAVAGVTGLSALSVAATPAMFSLSLGLLPAAEGGSPGAGLSAGALAGPMFATLLVVQLLPLALGMLVLRARPALAARLAPALQRASNLLLIGVIVALLAARHEALVMVGGSGLLSAVALTLAALALGAAALPAERATRRASALLTGVRNISVSLMLAELWFPDPLTVATVLAQGLFTMLLPFGLALWWGRAEP
ncbi:MAG: hypothetical protein H6741_02215 [Alphaproteobacteria bacterium]|nr:hypothetical protein [Alphaproteobacteria bacterium]MCB9791518.1 hypothetical protein [Alphaproteobacteria bacterium]